MFEHRYWLTKSGRKASGLGYPLAGPGDIGSDCTRRTLVEGEGVRYARSSACNSRLHNSGIFVGTDGHSSVMLILSRNPACGPPGQGFLFYWYGIWYGIWYGL